MRRVIGTVFTGALTVLSVSCTDLVTDEGIGPAAPTGLTYRLEPSGDPVSPNGLILHWDDSGDPYLASYNVYSRETGGEFGLRGTTTSPSFHDNGVPHLEYYVTAVDDEGFESGPSGSVMVDERLRLPRPNALTSISLDAAIHLSWSDNAFQSDPDGFWHYRVYSAAYDLDNGTCGTGWTLEGTTVSPAFLSAALVNGSPRCFGVSAITIEGIESLWSALRFDTPRPDAVSQLISTTAADPLRSGFRFFLDINGDNQAGALELGIITQGTLANIDFSLSGTPGNLVLTPVRANTDLQLYGTSAISSLTDIDIAPVNGYSRNTQLAQAGRGYVFRMNENDGFYRYGAIKIVAVGTDYIIFDWSYQTDRGNPELIRVLPTTAR